MLINFNVVGSPTINLLLSIINLIKFIHKFTRKKRELSQPSIIKEKVHHFTLFESEKIYTSSINNRLVNNLNFTFSSCKMIGLNFPWEVI
jgi:hypothetical protein